MERLQKNWKDHFNAFALERGRVAYENQRVDGLKENGGLYSAAILGRQRNEVSLSIRNGLPIRMSCRCPVAKGSGFCEHLAALLYAIEGKQNTEDAEISGEPDRASAGKSSSIQEEVSQTDGEVLNRRQIGQRIRRLRAKAVSGEAEEKERQEEIARLEKLSLQLLAGELNKKTSGSGKGREFSGQDTEMEKKRTGSAEEHRKEGAARKTAWERKKQEEERRKQEEERRKQEEERRKQEEERRKQEEERRKQEAAEAALREERRAAREKRKVEQARKEAERKQAAEAERQKQLEKQQEEAERQIAESSRLMEENTGKKENAEREQKRLQRNRARMVEEAHQKVQENRKARASEEYELLGEPWREDPDAASGSGSFSQLEQYSYFDGDQILSNFNLPADSRRMGQKLYEQGAVGEVEISSGYERFGREDEMIGQAVWNAQVGRSQFQVTVTFGRRSVRSAQCGCPKCLKKFGHFGWYYSDSSNCEYVAAVLFALRDFLKTHNIGDATDRDASALIVSYRQKRANRLAADVKAEEESLTLVPRLVRKNAKLTVSFKIGQGRLFVIKQLDEFCDHVRNADTATYGSNTEINHRRSNFTKESQKWLRFIERIVQEEEEFAQRLEDATRSRFYYQKTVSVGSSLNLFGWRLDEFYNEIGTGAVDYEDRDSGKTRKLSLTCAEGNPRIAMQISEARLDQREGYRSKRVSPGSVFHGIEVEGSLPELYFGMNCAYYVRDSDHTLCRSDQGFQEKIEALTRMIDEDGDFSFRVGRNSMSEFYYQVLPALEDVVDVIETDPDRIRSFLPPQVSFVFYLDTRDHDVVCGAYARYEGNELPLLDTVDETRENPVEVYRDVAAEQETLYRALNWLPQIDMARMELNCGGDEDLIYRLMSEGVEDLLTLGEVQCTTRFRARRTIRQVKVSVGVSVSSGLLDLEITTEDVPQDELLDILNSYRQKKNYYRLKDGSYVDLDDHSLEMLAEVMDSMHLKPKEFVQGKMHLPLYRTLYLNKMLEENDSVYSDRDSHFREMVKGFKTVNDADFDVPKSLSKTMRQYQKDGYKWLRTLETWQFGGILADDMGLGKTLQAIALLLSAKERREQEGSSGESSVSLIVAPASLVFNWGEEFARFAPALRILLITGTQEERQEKIASFEEYDVLVTSYDLLKRDIHHYEGMEFEYEIIDEAQYIKNHTTAAAKAVKVIKSRYRFALTGTPIENRLSELWSIFDYLMPGFLYSYEVFKREIETPVVKYQDEQAMKRLQKMTSPFILRRLKEDVLKDLPDKLEEVRYVRLTKEQQQLYDGQVLHMRETIAGQDADEFNKNKLAILAELMRLRQICCDPSLCFEGYQGESAKADACMDLIQSAIDGGHRMLLFSQFTSMLEILQGRLAAEQIPYFTITGATSKQKRLELVKEYNSGDIPVFLISLKAGGVGLNLTGADVVIHYDPWWNVAAQNQATDRAHRIGQTKKVTVYKLIAKNSIEEKILKLQQDKRALADQVISGETGQLGGMTRDDLLELLDGKIS